MDTGLLVLRLTVGVVIAAHGAQKIFGWFGGYGIAGTGGFFESIGFRPGRLAAAAAGASEFAGGLLIALGLFGPLGPAAVLAVMVVAAISVHWGHGLFATSNGVELPLLYAAAAVALALTGPGGYSLDAALGAASLSTPALAWSAIIVGLVGAAATLVLRSKPARAAAGA